MDKNRLCTALYALPGDIVVKHRKPLFVPLLMAAAGAGLLGLNAFLEDAALNNLKSAIALVGGTLLVIGAVWALARLSGSQGTPYHRPSRSFMRFEELYFDRGIRSDVMQAVSDGDAERLLGMKRAQVPALTVALYRTPGNRFAAMQAFEYADLEYKPLTELKIADKTELKVADKVQA